MSKPAGPSAYPTKASNQVQNVLEARGLGLQLFFKGLLEKNRGGQDTPPPHPPPPPPSARPASDTLSPGMAVLRDQRASLFPFPVKGQPPLNTTVAETEFGYNLQVLFSPHLRSHV